MVATLLRGAFAAMLALALCFAALYLWLEPKLGTIAALGILGGTSALLSGVLFAIAFLCGSRKPRARAADALRAAADPAQASAAAIGPRRVGGSANYVTSWSATTLRTVRVMSMRMRDRFGKSLTPLVYSG